MSATTISASEVAAALSARLAAILTANGCETNIGARVYQGRRAVDESVIPCAVLIEGNDTPTQQPGLRMTSVSIVQRFVAVAYVACDPDNPNTAAHAAIRDIKRAFFAGEPILKGQVRKLTYRGRDIGPRADGAPFVYVQVDLDVEYVEDLANP